MHESNNYYHFSSSQIVIHLVTFLGRYLIGTINQTYCPEEVDILFKTESVKRPCVTELE